MKKTRKAPKSTTVKKVRKGNQVTRKSNLVPFPVFIRELGSGDYENWAQAYAMLGPAQNEWDEGPWKDSELTRAKFREMLREQVKHRNLDQKYSFGIFRQDDGVLVGLAYLMDVSRGVFQNAYVGYRIFNPYWGHGYATAAVRLVTALAFTKLKLHRLEAGISPDNKASIKVARRAGLRLEGLSKKRLLVNGKWVDLLIYAATCEDFGRRYRK